MNGRVYLNFSDFALQPDLNDDQSPNGHCGTGHARFRLFDSNYTAAFGSNPHFVNTFCGFTLPNPFISSGQCLSFMFDTGGSFYVQSGFDAALTVSCRSGFMGPNCMQPDFSQTISVCAPASTPIPPNGQVTSPGYPGGYGVVNCKKRFVAQPGYQYVLQVTDLDLNPTCAKSYLEIDDGTNQILHRCGSTIPQTVVISSNATVKFVTTVPSTGIYTGFSVKYYLQRNNCYGVNCGHGTCTNLPTGLDHLFFNIKYIIRSVIEKTWAIIILFIFQNIDMYWKIWSFSLNGDIL